MNNLPIETIHQIIDYLDLDDLASCKLVNRQFYRNIKGYRIKELSFWFYAGVWFSINRPIKWNYCNASHLAAPILRSSSFNFDYLKCLSISCTFNSKINLIDINKLDKLEVLIINLDEYRNVKCTKLSLNNLINLQIYQSNYVIVEIDTPLLKALNCSSFNRLKIQYPQTVQHLKIDKYSCDILMFSNLECLVLADLVLHHSNELDQFKLENLSKLIELQVLDDWSDRLIMNIIEQKTKLMKVDLKVYLKGVLVLNLDEISSSKNYDVAKDLNKYEQFTDILDWVKYVHYNQLMNSINQQLPVSFFKKYCNIINLEVNGKVIDQDNLIYFISNCKVLKELIIFNSELDQSFYDQLAIVSLIERLTIQESSLSSFEINLDFNFIFNMIHLSHLTTNQQLSIDLISRLDELKYIKRVIFEVCENLIIFTP